MKKVLLAILVIGCYGQMYAQGDSIRQYLTDALDLMKQYSVNKNKLNWTEIYASAQQKAAKASKIRDTYPAIREALGKLGDAHSNFYPPQAVAALYLGYRATNQEFPIAEASLIDGRYAYITVPAIGCLNMDDWHEYITRILQQLDSLDQKDPQGWIIDLRNNNGGMLQPMYAAFHPFFGAKKLIGSRDVDQQDRFYTFRKNTMYYGKRKLEQFSLPKIRIRHTSKPVIILTSKQTGSSGEFMTIAFRNLPNTQLLGTYTNGLTSDNTEHKLADGAFLVLTEGSVVDRKGRLYDEVGKGVAPDIEFNDTGNTTLMLEKAKALIDAAGKRR